LNTIFAFIIESILFGTGLAMDAFSVSFANGLGEPKMRAKKVFAIAGTFAFFQFAMPMLGWFFVHTAAERFEKFHKLIPWIALILLLFIGGKMLIEGVKNRNSEAEPEKLKAGALFVQGIATSIDALSVGFTIADLTAAKALAESAIIGAVTFAICVVGLKIGKKAGDRLAGKAMILGGVILIAIGIEIFVSSFFK